MNELLFFLQIGAIVLSVAISYRFGKEGVIAAAALLAVLANLFVLKQITIFGLSVTGTDAFVIGYLMSLNLLGHKFGMKEAKKAMKLSFLAMLFVALFSYIHLLFSPNRFDSAHGHYRQILGPSPRLFGASLLTFFAVQQIEIRLFGQMGSLFPKLSWRLRSATSLILSQAIDTCLFTLLGLYGIVENLLHVFWVSFTVKCAAIGAMTLIWREKQYEV